MGIYDANLSGTKRGSPVYAQNRDGTRYIRDTITFRNFTTGMKAYTEGGYADGFHFEGNVPFDAKDWNLFGSGKTNPMRRLKVISNYTWLRPDSSVRSVQFGYYNEQVDAVYRDNYFVGGTNSIGAFYAKKWSQVEVTGNTMISPHRFAYWEPGTLYEPVSYLWNNNQYFGGGSSPFVQNGTAYTFTNWKAATGFDQNSSYTSSYPTQTKVFIRRNLYDPKRANIVIYNWAAQSSVAVDLSSIVPNEATYQIRDAQNYFGAPVVSGTYSGGTVSIPMNLTTVAPLVGNVTHIENKHTAPEFGVFVLTW